MGVKAKTFTHHESYKHKAAKELLYSWLRRAANSGGVGLYSEDPFFKSFPFDNRCERVAMELPFTSNGGVEDPNNERDLYAARNKWLAEMEYGDPIVEVLPNQIMFVPDIALFHEGSFTTLIEVVHKNKVSYEKMLTIRYFYGFYCGGSPCEVYEVSADEILNCTNLNRRLSFNKIYKG